MIFEKYFFQRKTGRSDAEGRKGWSPGADQNPIWEKIELLRARISKPTTELLFKSHSLMKHYTNPRLRENESFLKNSLGENRRARFRVGLRAYTVIDLSENSDDMAEDATIGNIPISSRKNNRQKMPKP